MGTININKEDKFELLKNFGFDLAGAVFIELNTDYLDLNIWHSKENFYN